MIDLPKLKIHEGPDRVGAVSELERIEVRIQTDAETREGSIGYLSGSSAEHNVRDFTYEDPSIFSTCHEVGTCEFCKQPPGDCMSQPSHLELPCPIVRLALQDQAIRLVGITCLHCSQPLYETGSYSSGLDESLGVDSRSPLPLDGHTSRLLGEGMSFVENEDNSHFEYQEKLFEALSTDEQLGRRANDAMSQIKNTMLPKTINRKLQLARKDRLSLAERFQLLVFLRAKLQQLWVIIHSNRESAAFSFDGNPDTTRERLRTSQKKADDLMIRHLSTVMMVKVITKHMQRVREPATRILTNVFHLHRRLLGMVRTLENRIARLRSSGVVRRRGDSFYRERPPDMLREIESQGPILLSQLEDARRHMGLVETALARARAHVAFRVERGVCVVESPALRGLVCGDVCDGVCCAESLAGWAGAPDPTLLLELCKNARGGAQAPWTRPHCVQSLVDMREAVMTWVPAAKTTPATREQALGLWKNYAGDMFPPRSAKRARHEGGVVAGTRLHVMETLVILALERGMALAPLTRLWKEAVRRAQWLVADTKYRKLSPSSEEADIWINVKKKTHKRVGMSGPGVLVNKESSMNMEIPTINQNAIRKLLNTDDTGAPRPPTSFKGSLDLIRGLLDKVVCSSYRETRKYVLFCSAAIGGCGGIQFKSKMFQGNHSAILIKKSRGAGGGWAWSGSPDEIKTTNVATANFKKQHIAPVNSFLAHWSTVCGVEGDTPHIVELDGLVVATQLECISERVWRFHLGLKQHPRHWTMWALPLPSRIVMPILTSQSNGTISKKQRAGKGAQATAFTNSAEKLPSQINYLISILTNLWDYQKVIEGRLGGWVRPAGDFLRTYSSDSTLALYKKSFVTMANLYMRIVGIGKAMRHENKREFDPASHNPYGSVDKSPLQFRLGGKTGLVRSTRRFCVAGWRAVLVGNDNIPKECVALGLELFMSQFKRVWLTPENFSEYHSLINRIRVARQSLREVTLRWEVLRTTNKQLALALWEANLSLRLGSVYPNFRNKLVPRFEGDLQPETSPIPEPVCRNAAGGAAAVRIHQEARPDEPVFRRVGCEACGIATGMWVEITLAEGDNSPIFRTPTLSRESWQSNTLMHLSQDMVECEPYDAAGLMAPGDPRSGSAPQGLLNVRQDFQVMGTNPFNNHPYNADNDGDAMVGIPSRTERMARVSRTLSHSRESCVSSEAGTNCVIAIQNTLILPFCATQRGFRLPPQAWHRILMRAARYVQRGVVHPVGLEDLVRDAALNEADWGTRDFLSRFLPPGVLRQHVIDNGISKSDLTQSRSSLVRRVFSLFGPTATTWFLNGVAWLSSELASYIFASADTAEYLDIPKELWGPVEPPRISDASPETDVVVSAGPIARERWLSEQAAAESARAQEALDVSESVSKNIENQLKQYVEKQVSNVSCHESTIGNFDSVFSGAKGDYHKMVTLFYGLFLQQYGSSPIPATLGGRRSFFAETNPAPMTRRGFVCNSYMRGLTLQELLLTMVAARRALADGTRVVSRTGTDQRLATFAMQNCILSEPGAVNTTDGMVVSLWGKMSDWRHVTEVESPSYFVLRRTHRSCRQLGQPWCSDARGAGCQLCRAYGAAARRHLADTLLGARVCSAAVAEALWKATGRPTGDATGPLSGDEICHPTGGATSRPTDEETGHLGGDATGPRGARSDQLRGTPSPEETDWTGPAATVSAEVMIVQTRRFTEFLVRRLVETVPFIVQTSHNSILYNGGVPCSELSAGRLLKRTTMLIPIDAPLLWRHTACIYSGPREPLHVLVAKDHLSVREAHSHLGAYRRFSSFGNARRDSALQTWLRWHTCSKTWFRASREHKNRFLTRLVATFRQTLCPPGLSVGGIAISCFMRILSQASLSGKNYANRLIKTSGGVQRFQRILHMMHQAEDLVMTMRLRERMTQQQLERLFLDIRPADFVLGCVLIEAPQPYLAERWPGFEVRPEFGDPAFFSEKSSPELAVLEIDHQFLEERNICSLADVGARIRHHLPAAVLLGSVSLWKDGVHKATLILAKAWVLGKDTPSEQEPAKPHADPKAEGDDVSGAEEDDEDEEEEEAKAEEEEEEEEITHPGMFKIIESAKRCLLRKRSLRKDNHVMAGILSQRSDGKGVELKPPKKNYTETYHYKNTGLFLTMALQSALKNCLWRTRVTQICAEGRAVRFRLAPQHATERRLRRLATLPFVEQASLRVNDARLAHCLWGVLSAERCIAQELRCAMEEVGLVNQGHFDLIAAAMTREGHPSGIKNFGMSSKLSLETCILSNCGKEWLCHTLGENSESGGIIASIIAGKKPRVGVNYMQLQ